MKKLFILDDDRLITAIYSDFLSANGYAVLAANSAFGATNSIMDHDPDVLLLDLNLPGLSGRGFLKVIKVKREFKVILISGDSQKEEMQAIIDEGHADDFFVKGEPLGSLVKKIGILLSGTAEMLQV
jgi:DNA-binding response OmpR family regulator